MPSYNEKVAYLRGRGFVVGTRDPNLNRAFKGAFMVAEAYEPGTVTGAAAQGPWCIVGDDLPSLVRDAFECWYEG